MINFDNIAHPRPFARFQYWLLYQYVNIVHKWVYYQRYYVLHKERIPHGEPVVAISNHQNGLTDALGILFAFKKDGRYVVFIARADIFRLKIAAVLLRWLKIMPAFRSVDVGKEGLDDNDAIFDEASKILVDNGVVSLFPEAGHEDCHHLGTFKKGFARIAFRAAELTNFEKPIHILPMSNHYSDYFGVQNKLIVTVGEPFTFEDLYDLYREHPKRAQKILTDRARVKVKALMLDIEDKSLYNEFDTIRTVYDKHLLKAEGKSARYFPNVLDADQRIVASVGSLRNSEPERFDRLISAAHEYSHLLDKLYLRDWIFRQNHSFGAFLVRLLLALALIPFIIYGFIVNFIPFNAATLVTRRIKDQMLHSSFLFVIGALIAYPLWYIALLVTTWYFFNWWIALIYVFTLPPTFVLYIHSKIIVAKQFNRLRRFRLWFEGNRFLRRATELRKEIVKVMSEVLPANTRPDKSKENTTAI